MQVSDFQSIVGEEEPGEYYLYDAYFLSNPETAPCLKFRG